MRTMDRLKVINWLESKKEDKLVERLNYLYGNLPVLDVEKLGTIFYLTLGSRKGPELFREMQCEVTTTLILDMV